MTAKKCLTQKCRQLAASDECRGLCLQCYTTAKRLVASNQTTWEKLENAGFVLRKLDPFEEQFLRLNATTVVDPGVTLPPEEE